jgi:[acyl-carrier-protein] S-malonyltransferase
VGVDQFAAAMSSTGAKLIPLNVSAPFHCSLMKAAAVRLAKDLDATTFSDPKFPVFANVTGKPVETAAQARELLKQQVCGTVRWTDSIQNLVADVGITRIIEFGPGGVLSKLAKRIDKSLARLEVFDPASMSATATALKPA